MYVYTYLCAYICMYIYKSQPLNVYIYICVYIDIHIRVLIYRWVDVSNCSS